MYCQSSEFDYAGSNTPGDRGDPCRAFLSMLYILIDTGLFYKICKLQVLFGLWSDHPLKCQNVFFCQLDQMPFYSQQKPRVSQLNILCFPIKRLKAK